MQYILSEEEYKKLIHRDRINGPVTEFLEAITKSDASFSPYQVTISRDCFQQALETLRIKLDI